MREPLTDREILGLHVFRAVGDHLADLCRDSRYRWSVLLSRSAYQLLKHDMPQVLRKRGGSEFMFVMDRHNFPWHAEVRVRVTDDPVPSVEHVPVGDGKANVRITFGTLRRRDSASIKIL